MRKTNIESEVEITDDSRLRLNVIAQSFPKFSENSKMNYYSTVFIQDLQLKIQLYYAHEYFYKIKISRNDVDDKRTETKIVYTSSEPIFRN